MTFCACALVRHPFNKDLYLSVSRKDDPDIHGLPGGKYEENDDHYAATAIRETLEETGFSIKIVTTKVFTEYDNDNKVFTYFAELKDENDIYKDIKPTCPTETGVVKWVTAKELINGPFKQYNEQMFRYFAEQL